MKVIITTPIDEPEDWSNPLTEWFDDLFIKILNGDLKDGE